MADEPELRRSGKAIILVVDRVRPPGTTGLGLGLFIAQQIARSHGGSIAVTSSESDGTIFRVRLPRGAAAVRTSEGAP